MLRSNLPTLLASAAFLLATAGCTLGDLDGPAATLPVSATADQPAQDHRLFDAEKANAVMSELPAQF